MVDSIVSFGSNLPNDFEEPTSTNYVHIRIQQRNNRKCLTLIEGMPADIDLKKVLRYFKKTFSCNGTIVNNEENDEKIIQLTGDNRSQVAEFLKEECIVPEDCIKIHGH
ncbi:unnamed protein product [Blepharisma stoltei]|uniref:SUI1 domain-containing protein n=1 Tax=Blepharisma stoltei TaxID=1481888 RepID=A0AAU9KEQ3_9CILI|nr:unnamed protein product [Blepharisma stoltei]